MARTINNSFCNADGTAPQYLPGREPDNIKKRLVTLFAKLDDAYPDYVISGLQTDHKKWAETVTELYRELGYDSGDSFLAAYGYTVQRKRAGRTASVNPDEIIEELKKRYPNGADFKSVDVLFSYNPDLLGKKKTLANNAQQYWGMSFSEYLMQQGLLRKKDSKEKIKVKEMEATNQGQTVKKEKQTVWYLIETYPQKQIEAFQAKPDYAELGRFIRLENLSNTEAAIGKLIAIQNDPPVDVPIWEKYRLLRTSQFMAQLVEIAPFEAGTILNDLFGMFSLSQDGTVLIDYFPEKNPDTYTILIPQGVTQIKDNVFLDRNFWYVYLPDSVETLGDSVMASHKECFGSRVIMYPRTNIKRIAAASANLHFFADDDAFYRIRENGAKELLYRFPKTEVKEIVKKEEQGIFSGYEFCVADDNQGSDLKDLITRNGGSVVAEMGDMTDFLIVSKTDHAAEEKTKKRKVRIMPEEVLRSLCKVS